MGHFPLVELIQEAFPPVAAIVTQLANNKVSRALGQLGAYLCSFAEEAFYFTPQQCRRLERGGWTLEVLERVEKAICCHEVPPSTDDPFPVLRKLSLLQQSVDEGRQGAKESMRSLGSKIQRSLLKQRHRHEEIIKLLQDCSGIAALPCGDDIDLSAAYFGNDSVDYSKQVKLLRNVIHQHTICNCENSDPTISSRHLTRLRLKPTTEHSQDDVLQFQLLFSASSNPVPSKASEWQHVFMKLPARKKSRRRVRWDADHNEHEANPSHPPDLQLVGEGQFCSYISSKVGAALSFVIDNNQLQISSEIIGFQTFRPTMGLNLGLMIEQYQLRYGMRPVLAYNLAQSVWNFYDSDWVGSEWTNKNIYFMEEAIPDDEETTAYFCKPFLSAGLDNGESQVLECQQVFGIMHRYPRVLALGMMLIEIATGRSLASLGSPSQWNARTSNDRLIFLKSFLHEDSFEADCKSPSFRQAVTKCLGPDLFKNAPFNPRKPSERLEERRSILRKEIVEPLRKLVEGAGWDTEFDKMENEPLAPKVATTRCQPEVNAISKYVSPSSCSHKSDNWLKKIARVNEKVKGERKKPPGMQAIRIAVLDTGYDCTAPCFDIPGRENRIKRWEDFVAASPKPVDRNGHGTHLVALLLQVAPFAELYIARIAEDSDGLGTARENVAEASIYAIRRAACDWDVDFVSMSFGFSSYDLQIKEAISEATYRKKGHITFFAAAANDGSNSQEMFPANMGESVLSIRGTNRAGGFEADFNPPPSSPEPVFGTLGRDVESDWIAPDLSRSMSGCSVATPIAAGIAATLIHYATLRHDCFLPEELKLMRTRRGVFELFKAIGVRKGENRYYIAPFILFELSEEVRIAKLKTAINRHPHLL